MHPARRAIPAVTTLALIAVALAVPRTAHAAGPIGWLGTELGGLDVVVDQSTPATVTLIPPQGAAETGTQARFPATIGGSDSVPLANRVARFEVVGAHNLRQPLSSNAAGGATFCYDGATVGT